MVVSALRDALLRPARCLFSGWHMFKDNSMVIFLDFLSFCCASILIFSSTALLYLGIEDDVHVRLPACVAMLKIFSYTVGFHFVPIVLLMLKSSSWLFSSVKQNPRCLPVRSFLIPFLSTVTLLRYIGCLVQSSPGLVMRIWRYRNS